MRTARPAASTPAAPLMPKNQGVGRESMRVTRRIPVGKPNPISSPAGAKTSTQNAARAKRPALSNSSSTGGIHAGNATR